MTKDEALRLALEALELVSIEFVCNGAHHAKKDRHEWLDPCPIVDRYKDAITAIKAALEAKDKPDYKALWQQMCERCDELDKKLAQRKPLTDEQIGDEFVRFQVGGMFTPFLYAVRAIEAAHGIKGEA